MTYNVFGGTLSLTQSIITTSSTRAMWWGVMCTCTLCTLHNPALLMMMMMMMTFGAQLAEHLAGRALTR